MARSKCVYVVRRWTRQQPILGVFTVKHEMITTIARAGLSANDIMIHRYPDGKLFPKAHAGEKMWASWEENKELQALIEEERIPNV